MRYLDDLGPYDSVLDVGGNLGDFAERCRQLWPEATITSFEPLPEIANQHRRRANNRWLVVTAAVSDRPDRATLRWCENQHSASTMQQPGPVRSSLGIRDRFTEIPVTATPLDEYLDRATGRLLVKVDVEGHERAVLEGARNVLARAATVVVEVQQDPGIFLGSPSPTLVDSLLRAAGLRFAGVADTFSAPDGRVLQFDGIWERSPRILDLA